MTSPSALGPDRAPPLRLCPSLITPHSVLGRSRERCMPFGPCAGPLRGCPPPQVGPGLPPPAPRPSRPPFSNRRPRRRPALASERVVVICVVRAAPAQDIRRWASVFASRRCFRCSHAPRISSRISRLSFSSGSIAKICRLHIGLCAPSVAPRTAPRCLCPRLSSTASRYASSYAVEVVLPSVPVLLLRFLKALRHSGFLPLPGGCSAS